MAAHLLISEWHVGHSEVATLLLFGLDGFKECLEVASAKALMVPALDDLEEERRSVLERLREDLEQVALVVVVDEDLLPLEHVNVLLHLDGHIGKASAQVVIVGVRDLIQEENATIFHTSDRLNDVLGAHGDMLNSGATIILAELLDLALSHAGCRLIDRHLDLLIEIRHYDRSQRGEVRVNHLVIDRPETMEVQHVLIPLRDGLHLTVLLIADTMIDVEELRDWHEAIERLGGVMWLIAG